MVKRMCRNQTVWKCDGCGKRIAQYTTLGGWDVLKDNYRVECGCPQVDQDDTRYYCPKCWEKVKAEMIKTHRLRDSDIVLIKELTHNVCKCDKCGKETLHPRNQSLQYHSAFGLHTGCECGSIAKWTGEKRSNIL